MTCCGMRRPSCRSRRLRLALRCSLRSRSGRQARGSEPFHRATRVGVEQAPADELLGEVSGRLVVDERERTEVLVTHGKDAAVVVATLALDGRDVAGKRADLVL